MLDTKLKNRHKLGVGLIALVIAAAAMSALALYPYMEKKAKSYSTQSSDYYQSEAINEVSTQLMNGVYSIWMEQEQQKAGHLLSPSQVFLPELSGLIEAARNEEAVHSAAEAIDDAEVVEEDIYYQDYGWRDSLSDYTGIQSFMDNRGESWKSNFRRIADQLEYQMADADGNVLTQSKKNTETDLVYTEIAYDSAGTMTIAYLESSQRNDLSEDLAAALNHYRDHDPIRESFDYEYMYRGITFEKPKNVVFRFWIPERLLTGDSMQPEVASINTYWFSNIVSVVGWMLVLLVSLAALILPCFPSLRLGQEKIFRAPFEIVTIVATFGTVLLAEGYMPSAMVSSTLNGLLAAEIQEAGFALSDAQSLAWVLNGVAWAVGFAMVYWVITCYRSVFVLGLWGYIKERTFIGYFCGWVKRGWDRFYELMQHVDFREKSTKIIIKVVLVNFLIVTGICCFWFFGVAPLIAYSVVLFFILDKYWGKLQEKYELLLNAFHQVATGNFNTRIDESLGIFEPFRDELDTIQDGLKQAVEKEVRSQSMKTELITNVSHDLKTPLTAIITYVNLLKEEHLSEEERASYIAVLEQKSMRLKVLIEDLFEVSKANSNNITLNLESVDVVSLMKQVRLELSEQLTMSGIDFRWDLPDEKITLRLDGQKTYRIFENLLTNITKYALTGTRAYIDMKAADGELVISMRNISAKELQVSGQDLTERFVRGDESRNTEGSGLGLAIAKSFTEVQGGRLVAETEADLFRVIISWPLKAPGPGPEPGQTEARDAAPKAAASEDTAQYRTEPSNMVQKRTGPKEFPSKAVEKKGLKWKSFGWMERFQTDEKHSDESNESVLKEPESIEPDPPASNYQDSE